MGTRSLLPIVLFVLWLTNINSPAKAFPFNRKVDSIQIVFNDQQLILPGEAFRIGVTSFRKGKARNTMGILGGSVWWLKYKVDVVGGTDFGGKISVNERLIPSKGKYIGLKIYPRKQPELQKEILLPLNYDTKIVYRATNKFDKAPGSLIKGELETEFNNGITRVDDNLRNSKELAYFQFSSKGGSWDDGKFIIDPDFMNIEEHRAALIVNSLRNRTVADTFAVLLDYRHTYDLHFRSSSGSNGFSGANGMSGSTGENGYDGGNGQNGEPGYNGPDIGVYVDLYHDSILHCNLLYVYAQNQWTGEESRYLINPDGGKLNVSSTGGDGGNGGNGGNGGSGGQGYEGETWIETHIEKRTVKKPVTKTVTHKRTQKRTNAEGKEEEYEVEVEETETVYVDEVVDVVVEVVRQGPGGPGGDGGWGGDGGYGGPGGDGGNINLYFTYDALKYQDVIVASSPGGSGGSHGTRGSGGAGGAGGHGNPNGASGSGGKSGHSYMGWADSGRRGEITIQPTEEFFNYVQKMEPLQTKHPSSLK